MVTHGDRKVKALTLAIAAVCLGSLFYAMPEAKAEGFIDDSSLNGGVYYWQRHRDRKDTRKMLETAEGSGIYVANPDRDKYVENLHHSTFNANLDFSSGYAGGIIGIDLAAFGALELNDGGPAYPNEIGFSNAKTAWTERYQGDKSGFSVYKAAVKLKYDNFWFRGGYLQPTGNTLLAPHWSFMPGTYRGFEVGTNYDFGADGAFSASYMWVDEYKAPWYRNTDGFRQADRQTGVSYLHSIGAKYDFKNNLVLEAAYGQAKDYVDQYFAKVSYSFPVAGNDLRTSYQFYGSKDKIGDENPDSNVYDGLAWLQGLTFGYTKGPFDFRLEGTYVKAEGNQGFFLQRMTQTYGSSNGRLDIWWDSRSDFNANGEKAVFAGVLYDLKNWELPGWAIGTSYAYGWDAKPSTNPAYDQSQRLKESAWNADIMYTIQEGRAKGTLFKLHYTRYDNHTDIPSWSGGYGNIFQDEKDVKFIVIAPFTIF